MAKNKGGKTDIGRAAVANRPIYSRVSFLYQAAALLARTAATPDANKQQQHKQKKQDENGDHGDALCQPGFVPNNHPFHGMARRLVSQMRAVSRKTNMRLRPAVKHRVCKYCDTLLVEGETCMSVVENKSRGGRKPWADLLVVTCNTCGRARRYPVSAPRQPRRPLRAKSLDRGDEGSPARRNSDEETKAEKSRSRTAQQEKTTDSTPTAATLRAKETPG